MTDELVRVPRSLASRLQLHVASRKLSQYHLRTHNASCASLQFTTFVDSFGSKVSARQQVNETTVPVANVRHDEPEQNAKSASRFFYFVTVTKLRKEQPS